MAAAAQDDESTEALDAKVREVRARAATRRARFEQEREAARRRREAEALAAAQAWDAKVREHREAASAAAQARAAAVEQARRDRLERAAALVSESSVNVDRRMRQLREAEAIRKRELTERADARAAAIAARKRAGREIDAALVDNLERTDLERQRQTELARAAAVQNRSADARQVARSWLIQPRDSRDEAPPPWPGEQAALEHRVVDVPAPRPPGPNRDRIRAALPRSEPEPVTEPRARTVPPPPALPAPPPRVAPPETSNRSKQRSSRAASRERVDVMPLDVDALNAILQEKDS